MSSLCKNYKYYDGQKPEDGSCLTCEHAVVDTIIAGDYTLRCNAPDSKNKDIRIHAGKI